MDIFLAYTGLLLFAPLMGAIAIAIRFTSPGPVIYRQKRVGYNGKLFELYKFRSMYYNSDENVHRRHITEVMRNFNSICAEEAPAIKIIKDVRVTPLGRFLRNTCLDELPQLINVLKGDMSMVGPRPHPEYEVINYDRWYRRRLSVKPGLTGLWQIQGRKHMFYPDAIRLDLSYIDRWSLGLDFKILFYTLPTALAGLAIHKK
ncbi:exopolysaccharide biosynthesis protein [candidate division KSB1 bacterium]|nr:exopolysaccharide biosynthesis protein [candidate division KSB1 bacterium]